MPGTANFSRLFDIPDYQAAKYPQEKSVAVKREGNWLFLSTLQLIDQVGKVSLGLIRLGVQPGDRVGILSRGGSPAWHVIDFALQQVGAVVVPLHGLARPDELQYIIRDAGIIRLFFDDDRLADKISGWCGSGEHPVVLHSFYPNSRHTKSSLASLMVASDPPLAEELRHRMEAIVPEDLATIIYTSGTTGDPKGVMLSHANIVSNIKATISLVPVDHRKTAYSFLPVSHVFERMVTYTYLAAGVSLYYASDLSEVPLEIRQVRPHFMTCVPRILERMRERVRQEAHRRNWVSRQLIFWALGLGSRFPSWRKGSVLYLFKWLVAYLLVFRVWRRKLGGRLVGLLVGAAPLQEDLARLFLAARIPLREGYGLTETAPVVSLNRFEPGGMRLGTVGIPIPGVLVRIQDPDDSGQGEIQVKGPNVMLGYYGKGEETRSVVTRDGWFRTGDIGLWEKRKFLVIADRKKAIFKSPDGKYVAPLRVEERLKGSPFIEQCLVIGYRRPFLSALIIPSFGHLQKWCAESDVHWTAPPYMVLNPKVVQKLKEEVDLQNQELASHERVRKFLLLPEEWEMGNSSLTATLKLRRDILEERYRKEIDALYQ